MAKKLIIYTDGAAQNNPGPAAIGVVLTDEKGRGLDTISRRIGRTTNNQAEYRAIIAGLERALELGASEIEVRSDSELVVKQLQGCYKIKHRDLLPLSQKVQDLRWRFGGFSIRHVRREDNRQADQLACQALAEKAPAAGAKAKVTVRRATKDDYEGMWQILTETEALHARALPAIFRATSSPAQDRDIILASLRDKSGVWFLAEKDGQIAGIIHVSAQEAPDAPFLVPRRYAKVNDLAVKKEFQRHGVGQALMAEAEKWTGEKGLKSIELMVWEFNKDAHAFYKRLGYNPASRILWKDL